MRKIILILRREYLTRIRKRSFLLMTLAGPLLMAALIIVPLWLSLKDVDIQIIQVIDESQAFKGIFENSATTRFEYADQNILDAKDAFYDTKYTAILYLPENAYSAPSAIRLFHKKQPSLKTLTNINRSIESVIESDRIKLKFGIEKNELQALKPKVDILTVNLDEQGQEETSFATVSMFLGYAGAILIYFFIFLYGVQIMRGVIEEKSNRIIEVIISSVKPFQLMAGKITGIALVGLTQFLLWILLTVSIINGIMNFLPQNVKKSWNQQDQIEQFIPEQQAQNKKVQSAGNLIGEMKYHFDIINFPLILGAFLFYFLGGYLLYGAMFAAVGAAVDSEADTQQFMFPITIPLILAIVVASQVMSNPDGPLAFWFSIIPFTSPVIMMVRIPFGVSVPELMLSAGVLIVSFLAITWLAGKIYRTGILMYGKKITYRELWKWLFIRS